MPPGDETKTGREANRGGGASQTTRGSGRSSSSSSSSDSDSGRSYDIGGSYGPGVFSSTNKQVERHYSESNDNYDNARSRGLTPGSTVTTRASPGGGTQTYTRQPSFLQRSGLAANYYRNRMIPGGYAGFRERWNAGGPLSGRNIAGALTAFGIPLIGPMMALGTMFGTSDPEVIAANKARRVAEARRGLGSVPDRWTDDMILSHWQSKQNESDGNSYSGRRIVQATPHTPDGTNVHVDTFGGLGLGGLGAIPMRGGWANFGGVGTMPSPTRGRATPSWYHSTPIGRAAPTHYQAIPTPPWGGGSQLGLGSWNNPGGISGSGISPQLLSRSLGALKGFLF